MFITVTAIINKRRGKSPWLIEGGWVTDEKGVKLEVGTVAGAEGAVGARSRGQGGRGGKGVTRVSLHSVRSCQEGIYG